MGLLEELSASEVIVACGALWNVLPIFVLEALVARFGFGLGPSRIISEIDMLSVLGEGTVDIDRIGGKLGGERIDNGTRDRCEVGLENIVNSPTIVGNPIIA